MLNSCGHCKPKSVKLNVSECKSNNNEINVAYFIVEIIKEWKNCSLVTYSSMCSTLQDPPSYRRKNPMNTHAASYSTCWTHFPLNQIGPVQKSDHKNWFRAKLLCKQENLDNRERQSGHSRRSSKTLKQIHKWNRSRRRTRTRREYNSNLI